MYLKITLSGLLMIALSYGVARFSFGLLAPIISQDLHLTSYELGTINSYSYLAYCIAIIISTVGANKLDPKLFVILSGLSAALGMIFIQMANSKLIISIGIFISGMSTGLASPALGQIVNNFINNNKDKANSWINAGTGFGIVVSGPISLYFNQDWRNVYMVFILISLLVLILNYIWLPKSNTVKVEEISKEFSFIKTLIKSRIIIISAIIVGISSAIYWTFAKSFISSINTYTDTQLNLFWIVVGISGILGGFTSNLIEKIGIKKIYIISICIISLSMIVLVIKPEILIFPYLSAIVFGGTYILITGIYIAWGIRVLPNNHSLGICYPFIALAFGQLIGSMLSGYLIDLYSYQISFYIFSCICLISLVLKPNLFEGTDDIG